MPSPATSLDRVAAFIDGWNFARATQGMGLEVDFRRLLDYIRSQGRLLRAFYYIGRDAENPSQQGFVTWLSRNGYQVVEKPVKVYEDDVTGVQRRKADFDIQIAVDALTLADRIDKAILFTGDGDFVPLVRALGMKGVRTQVVTTLTDVNGRASAELVDAADEFVELADLRRLIERPARRANGGLQPAPASAAEEA